MKAKEEARPTFLLEQQAGGLVAGVDEVGRGCIAGFVAAAAVAFPAPPSSELASLLSDSKALTRRQRERAFVALQDAHRSSQVMIGIGAASVVEIERLNILRATFLAMQRAILRLPASPSLALVDGNQPPPLSCAVKCVVGGDRISLSIAAASIVAKVVRDRGMERLDKRWPGYGWARGAGYPSPAHLQALSELGVTPHHRRTFGPVEAALSSGACRSTRRHGLTMATRQVRVP